MLKPKRVGLRGKLLIISILIVSALYLALYLCFRSNLSEVMDSEDLRRAETISDIFEVLIKTDGTEDSEPDFVQIQAVMDELVVKNDDIRMITIFYPEEGHVTVAAGSDRETVGSAATELEAQPIFTGSSMIVDNADVNQSNALRSTGIDNSDDNVVRILVPVHDADGKNIASIGVSLDKWARNGVISSQQVIFGFVSSTGLLALIAIFYFSLSKLFVRPVKNLVDSAKYLDESPAKKDKGHDLCEIRNLTRAFDNMATLLGNRDEEVNLLLDASKAISSELHVDKILEILCEKIATSQKITYCRIALLDADDESMVVRAQSAIRRGGGLEGKAGDRLPLAGDSFLRGVLVSKKPKILKRNEDVVDENSKRQWEMVLAPTTRSALLLPLIFKGRAIGIVIIGEMRRWERSPISAKKIDFYNILMSQAVVAIENAQLYEKTEWQVRELSVMHNISQAFTSTLDYQQVVSIVAKKVGHFVGAQYASVLLPDKKNHFLKIVASYNLSAKYVWSVNNKSRIPVNFGPLGRAFTEQKPIVIEDVRNNSDYKQWKSISLVQDYSSLIALPLMAKDQPIGVICIYFSEPVSLLGNEIELLSTAANEAAIAIENARIYENLQDAFVGTIKSLAETIDAKDAYTRGHSEKVAQYAEATGRGLGLSMRELQTIRYAGYLHDVGKIGIPDAILIKPGRLSEEEFQVIRDHPVFSDRILKPVDFPYPVQPLVRHHHERYDGKGYPDGLAGEEIPLGARILAVADAFEAMTSDRPYRKALSKETAINELCNNKGSQFDPRIVGVFMKMFKMDNEEYTQELPKGA